MTLTRRARERMSVGEPAYPSSTTRDTAYWRQYLGWPSESPQIKIDFSKMPKKPVSEGFVFPKSIEQELAEARVKIAELEEALKEYSKMLEMSKKRKSSVENEYSESASGGEPPIPPWRRMVAN
jgi:hypothetical protein